MDQLYEKLVLSFEKAKEAVLKDLTFHKGRVDKCETQDLTLFQIGVAKDLLEFFRETEYFAQTDLISQIRKISLDILKNTKEKCPEEYFEIIDHLSTEIQKFERD